MIAKIYVPTIWTPKYIKKQTLTNIKGEIDSDAIIVGDFNAPLMSILRSDRKSIRKFWP